MANARYHKGNVRSKLLNKGMKVLSSEGLGAVSLRRLAREVGIAPSSVYNHFANHDSLKAALATEGFHTLLELEKQAFEQGVSFEASIKAVARVYLLFAKNNPHLYRLMFSWEIGEASGFPELTKAGFTLFGHSVRWWYDVDYDPSRPISDYPAPLIAWSAIHGLSMLVIQRSILLKGTTDEALSDFVDEFEDHLFPALSAASQKGDVVRDSDPLT